MLLKEGVSNNKGVSLLSLLFLLRLLPSAVCGTMASSPSTTIAIDSNKHHHAKCRMKLKSVIVAESYFLEGIVAQVSIALAQ